MDIVLTTCTARKRPFPRLMRAEERYLGPRVDWCQAWAKASARPLYFFSGLYGVIPGHALLPWYDQVLVRARNSELERLGILRMRNAGIRTALLVLQVRETPGWAPYWETIEAIFLKAHIPTEVMLTELD